jgi:Tfp pilus assembly protein PilW
MTSFDRLDRRRRTGRGLPRRSTSTVMRAESGLPRRSAAASLRGEAGFSIAEFMIGVALSLAVLSSAVMVMSQVTRGYSQQLESATAQEEAQWALDFITRYLRAAGSNPYDVSTSLCPAGGTTFNAIDIDPNGTGLPNNIRIHADINPPNGLLGGLAAGTCTEANEDVIIAHDTTNLTVTKRDRNIDATPLAMTDGVISNLTFTFLDANRVATAVEANIAYVQVAVTGRTTSRDEYTRQQTSYTVTNEVRVRSR